MDFISKEKDENLRKGKLKRGDIILTTRGTVGNVAYFNENIPYENIRINSGMLILRPNVDKIHPYYLYLFLRSNLFKKQVISQGSGSAQPQLPIGSLKYINLPWKDIATQQKIASVLSSLDSKIELNNRINAELEAMAKTLYDYWFVQFDFPNAQGKAYKTSGGAMVWNKELKREIPEGWEVGTMLNFGEIIGGSTPPREKEEYFSTNGTAWITPKDLSLNTGNKFITKGELDVSEQGLKVASLNIMPKGTILLSSRAPIGYLAISRENVTTNQGFKSFVPNKGFPTEYVYYAVKNLIPTIENNAVGSTFKEVSASTLTQLAANI